MRSKINQNRFVLLSSIVVIIILIALIVFSNEGPHKKFLTITESRLISLTLANLIFYIKTYPNQLKKPFP
jgi:hypothetical protein